MLKPSPMVLSYRKSHLKSGTYRNLLRIISCCSSQPRLFEEAALFPSRRRPISDNINDGSSEIIHSGMHDGDRNNSLDRNGSAVAVNVDLGDHDLRDNGLTNTHAVIHEIEKNMMGVEDICGGVVKEALGGNDCSGGNLFADGDVSMAQQSLIAELEYALKGNEGSVLNGNCNTTTSWSDKNDALHQETFRPGRCGSSASKDPDLTSASKASFVAQDNCLLQRIGQSGQKIEMSVEVGEWQESVCAATSQSSSGMCEFEDGEIVEEGEISGEFEHNGLIIDAAEKTIVPSGEKITCKESNQKHETNKKDSALASFQMNVAGHAGYCGATNDKVYIRDAIPGSRKVVVYEDHILNEDTGSSGKQSQGNRARKRKKDHEATPRQKDVDHVSKKANKGLEPMGEKKHFDCEIKRVEIGHEPIENKKVAFDKNDINYKANFPDNVPVQAHGSSADATAEQGTSFGEKYVGPDNKKKRGPPSAERKAKKKQKERKKRAEKNREQGVNRLKLRPVQIPKPVSFCRHFLMGTCREGEKCKFSHDTIPLTKSKPCKHFARQACMKGDDCPYDHQLSKYPCSKFVSEGFCKRGKACLFSHEVPLNEGLPSPSSVVTTASPGPTSSILGTSDSKKKLDITRTSSQMAKALDPSTGYISHKPLEQTIATAPRVPLQVPKGITILSHGKASASGSNQLQPKYPATKEGIKCANQASGKVQRLNETPVKRPVQPPKGINFLSFCRSPLESPPPAKFNRPSVNHSSSAEVSIPRSLITDEQTGTSASLDDKIGGQMKSEFAPSLPKLLHSSTGETSTSGSKLHEWPSFLNLSRFADKPVESNKSLSDNGPNLCANPWAWTTSPSGLGQSSYNVGKVSNPVQKAMMSTLAFAAKIESDMKSIRSASAAKSLSSDRDEAAGGVQKDTPPSTSKTWDLSSTVCDTQNK